MAIGKDNERIVTIVSREIYNIVEKLAQEDKRSISAMTAILIEKGINSLQNK